MKGKGRLACLRHVDDDSMSSIISSSRSGAYVCVGSEDVDELSLAFVAPLCPQDNVYCTTLLSAWIERI